MRKPQGDIQEKRYKVCTPKLGYRGIFLSSVEKAHQPTEDLCIFPNFPGLPGPHFGKLELHFPYTCASITPTQQQLQHRGPVTEGMRSLNSILSLPSSFAAPVRRMVLCLLPHGKAVSSISSSHTPTIMHLELCVSSPLFRTLRSWQNTQLWAGPGSVSSVTPSLSFSHDAFTFDLLQICLFVLQTESYCWELLAAFGDIDCQGNSL